jgi:hypothetical protein
MYAEKFKIDVVKLMKRWDYSKVTHIFMQTENLIYVNIYHRGVCFIELCLADTCIKRVPSFYLQQTFLIKGSTLFEKVEHWIEPTWCTSFNSFIYSIFQLYSAHLQERENCFNTASVIVNLWTSESSKYIVISLIKFLLLSLKINKILKLNIQILHFYVSIIMLHKSKTF